MFMHEAFEARASRTIEVRGGGWGGGGPASSAGTRNNDRSKGKGDAGGNVGAGTRVLSDADIIGTGTGWNQTGSDGPSISRRGKGNSGTTATANPVPGSVPIHPWADAPAIIEKAVLPAAPVVGSLLSAASAVKALTDEDDRFGTLLGGDIGPASGFQPDRFKGKANMTGVGDPGSASGLSADERSIPGRGYSSGVAALVGDDETGNPWVGDPALFSDVTLQDRRKPRLTLAQLGAQLLA